MDTKQEQDTKQQCSNYQNHKHGEGGPARANTTMFLPYNQRLLPLVGAG